MWKKINKNAFYKIKKKPLKGTRKINIINQPATTWLNKNLRNIIYINVFYSIKVKKEQTY